ncbi:MAG: 30S ribosomal protein S2 [Candidatus Methylarchaceae archaeon HK02M2]|nr:30S ribosomal protein S2 [Candidatus Methylarchaceae archaeon HK02M2]
MVYKKNFEEKDERGASEKPIIDQLPERALLATGIRVGTVVKTKDMENFVGRTRPDGLHILDLNKILSRIDIAGKFIARSDIKRAVVSSTREYGKTPVTMFCSLTGAIPIVGRFMPGTFTNPLFLGHIDPELAIVTDPLIDAQVVDEASNIGVPVIAICDTDNVTSNVDLIIPGNNRGRRALAAIFWLLAKVVLISSGALSPDKQFEYSIEDFETKVIEEGTK